MAISNIIGPPVEGEDFYGRVKELARANALLDSGHSIILSAPRRIGKSSFAIRLIDDKEAEGWKCVYVDLEGVETKEQFLQELTQRFEGYCHTCDTLIVIGNLSSILNNYSLKEEAKNIAEGLLFKLRGIRQISDTHIRWLFDDSYSLLRYIRSHNLSKTINDLVIMKFENVLEDERDVRFWSEQLMEYNGQETGARYLLDVLSVSENGRTKQELMTSYMEGMGQENRLTANNELTLTLNMLEHDGYIIRGEDGARDFRSPLLKSWWRHTFVD